MLFDPEQRGGQYGAALQLRRGGAVRARKHVSKVVFDQSNVPGTGYIAAGPAALAAAAHMPIVQLTENVPISDANSVAIKEVDDAGPNGAVVLNFTPPEALVILQAAQKLGLEDRVKLWGCSTPCNTDFLATRSARSGTTSCSSMPS